MIDRRELITICRQIGTMMEVGVDFLRITRVLREQTDNPRLLLLYDDLEFELQAGKTLPEAMESAPDIFSPFAISIIERGEVRGDLQGAWHRLADHLKAEAQQDVDLGIGDASTLETPKIAFQTDATRFNRSSTNDLPTNDSSTKGITRLVSILLWAGAGLALFLALIQSAVALEVLAPTWATALRWAIVALYCVGCAQMLQRGANGETSPASETPDAEDDPFAL